MTDDNIRELQACMPWTDIWSDDFLSDDRPYSKYEHCLKNIVGRVGALMQECEISDHYGYPTIHKGLDRNRDGTALSYIIMSALKAANVYPDGAIDLAEYIKKDLITRGTYYGNTETNK